MPGYPSAGCFPAVCHVLLAGKRILPAPRSRPGAAWLGLLRALALLPAPRLLLLMAQILSKFAMFIIYLNYNI